MKSLLKVQTVVVSATERPDFSEIANALNAHDVIVSGTVRL